MPLPAYKANCVEVIKRLTELYERRAQDRIFASFEPPSPALAKFRETHMEGFCEYPDTCERVRFWDEYLAERTDLADDSIPSAYMSELDQGLYGGLLGADVRFMCHPDNGYISSMVAPILADWSGFESLKVDWSGLWMARYVEALRLFSERSAGKFGISHFILIDSLNFVFELVGATKTYMSLLEEPGMVRKAIDLGFSVNERVQSVFFESVPGLNAGTCSNMVQWMPGRVVSESIDPFHMTSVDYFERWGREPVERIFRCFDGGVLHIHANGRHLLEAACSLKGLKAIMMSDDRGFESSFAIAPELRKRAGDMPLLVTAGFDQFLDALKAHRLAGGVFYKVRSAPSTDAANRIMDGVRAYRA